MGSKRKPRADGMIPKSKRQQKLKSKLAKCDPFPIEDFLLRHPSLSDTIFNEIDDKNLVKCRTVSKSWCSIIDIQRNTWTRMIRKYYIKFKEDWDKIVYGTPLQMVRELALTVKKVSTGPDPSPGGRSAMGNCGYKPIHFAAINGNLTLYIFISEKVEVKLPKDNSYNDTPLDLAVEYGHLEIVKYIIQCIDMKGVEDMFCPFYYAARSGHLKIYKHLEDNYRGQEFKERIERVALESAASNGHLDVFKYIVDSFEDINPPEINGLTPLHLAARKGHLNICVFILSSDLSIKNPKAKTTGETPLHSAAEFGHLEVFEYIAGYYTDKNPKRRGDITPLHEAARNGHVGVCKHILYHVKDKNPIRKNGETLLHIVAKLGKRGKKNHLYNQLYLEVYKCIAETVEDKNPFDKNGATPLSITRNPYIYNYIHRIEKFFALKQTK